MLDSSPNLLLQKILAQAISQGAVDIHLSCGSPPAIRVQGELRFLESFGVLSPDMVNRFIVELASPEELEVYNQKKNLSVSKTLSRETRYRIHAFYQKNLPALSLHSLPIQIMTWADLELPQSVSAVFHLEKGLVVVSGPYNSGKTTVLFAMLEELNRLGGRRILSVERPIEYVLEDEKSMIQQMEVGRDVASFREALTAAREEDYDVVYVSDLIGEEVLGSVFDLIASGKLVIVELNALSAVGAIQDLLAQCIRQGIAHASDVCADNLELVLNIRLVPTESRGERLASEVLIMLPELRTLVREEKFLQIEGVLETAKRQGLTTLDQSIAELVNRGKISKQTAFEYARDPVYLKSLMKE